MSRALGRAATPVVALVAVLGILLAGCAGRAPAAEGRGLKLGVVAGRCDPARAAALVAAGAVEVLVDVAWDKWEPAPGVTDPSYVDAVRNRVATCARAGLRVVLSPGLQYPPSWVRSLPHASYREQAGNDLDAGPVNVVFSADVRAAVGRHLRDVVAALPAEQLSAFRLGTSSAGELGYPGPSDGPTDNLRDFWAFDEAAQTGRGLADGQARSPMPGWIPGQSAWNGAAIDAAAARGWLLWYSGALVNAVAWQAVTLAAAGFRGDFHVLLAGRGMSPDEFAAATASRLGGAGDPEGSVERGLVYGDQIPSLLRGLVPRLQAIDSDLVIDVTGLDDASAVRARKLDPPQDACQRGDEDRALAGHAGVEAWSSFRWTAALARAHGLRLVGENPGAPAGPATGAAPDSDALPEQVRRAPAYARGCGLETFFFAFEDDLFDPTSGVEAQTLTDAVRRAAAPR